MEVSRFKICTRNRILDEKNIKICNLRSKSDIYHRKMTLQKLVPWRIGPIATE
jgi:hypothetical protein